jgi:ubiquitin related modifier 1
MSAISLKVEFSGGLELLFNNQRSHTISIPAFVPLDNSTRPVSAPTQIQTDGHDATGEKLKQADMIYLIHYLRDHLLKERVELFVENGTV